MNSTSSAATDREVSKLIGARRPLFHFSSNSELTRSLAFWKLCFMFSVLISDMVARCYVLFCLSLAASIFRFLLFHAFLILFFPAPPLLSGSVHSTSCFLLVATFSFSVFVLQACSHPWFSPLFSFKSEAGTSWFLESDVLLASLYGSCDVFFGMSANGWLFFVFVATDLLPNCYLSWSCSAALPAGIVCESKVT